MISLPKRLCFTRRLSVVCLLATLHKNYNLSDFCKTYARDKGEVITFWKSSASGYRFRNILKDSSTLQDTAFFHNLAHISLKKLIGSLWKFYQRCIFGSHRDSVSCSGLTIRIGFLIRTLDSYRACLGGGLHSPGALFIVVVAAVVVVVQWRRYTRARCFKPWLRPA